MHNEMEMMTQAESTYYSTSPQEEQAKGLLQGSLYFG
jgi:hypothetical protein